MKKKNTLNKFRQLEVKETKKVKGGIRASDIPGGSGGSGFIDWGDVEIRFGSIKIITEGQISIVFQG